jgi:NADH dehydrogenase FAD-containing subunit
MFENIGMYARVAAFIFALAGEEIRNIAGGIVTRQQARWFGSTPFEDRRFNIVIVGASFAGHQVARIIANNLPPRSPYRVIVIEPSSHFVFTWVLPRYCVAKGHEQKAFVPYGGYTDAAPDGAVRWIKDRVVSVTRESVELQDSKEVIPYSHLVIATGSNVKHGLPSRVHETEKSAGMKLLQEMQQDVEKSHNLVVVGGGAAGVEVATDAKAKYPDKKVTLVHSRNALMHRFGEKLQVAALQGTEKLGVEVILEDRVVGRNEISKTVHLKSGRELECDFMVRDFLWQIYQSWFLTYAADKLCWSKA